MIKTITLAFGLSLVAAGAVLAQTKAPELAQPVASTAEECLKATYDIAKRAEDLKLSNEQIDKIEDLLTKMESHCDGQQFAEASAVGKDLDTLIATKRE
jgi:uncharacterized protein Yka (UPF0111/DUF47 family)